MAAKPPTPPPGHVPVMLAEVLEALAPAPGEVMLDGTVGLGGHAVEILRRLQPGGELIGVDRDPQALEVARERLSRVGDGFRLFHGAYSEIAEFLRLTGRPPGGALDGVLLDLGVSSFQLESVERGFSFLHDGPLDMRMDPSQEESAATFLRQATLADLARVFREYGEERAARRIARAIDRYRREKRIETTGQLADIVEGVLPRGGRRIHPATRCFQAIRIAVNRELEHLRLALQDLDRFLRPGGRVVVLSYHSLEDRITKQVLGKRIREGLYRRGSAKARRPTAEEVEQNPRARSAKMRIAIRAGES